MKNSLILKTCLLMLFIFASMSFVSAEGNFSALQDDIDNSGSEFIFNKNYTYNSGEDTGIAGIKINKSNFIIDGNGYTVNGNKLSRIFNITGHNVTIKNLIFINGYRPSSSVDRNGGAILNSGNYMTLINCTFENNSANSGTGYTGGGAIYNTGNNVNIINNSFINNSASSSSTSGGGAIYNHGANMIINGSNKFINNTATTGGGAIKSDGENLTIIGSNIFDNNSATSLGGAIYNNGSYFTISGNNNFTNNYAGQYGGAVYTGFTNNIGVNCTIIGSNNFINNTAGAQGGAIHNQDSANFTITGTNVFINNSANYGGAIMNIRGVNFLINGSNKFISNTGTTNAGVVQNQNGANFLINGTNEFINNTARRGGAIRNEGGANFTISGSNLFDNNTASLTGGAIYNNNVDIVIEGSNIFINNYSPSGGAIYNNVGNVTIVGTNTLNDNRASYGGAIYNMGNAFVNITGNNNLNNNSALRGGAVYNTNNGIFYINGNNFKNNNASNGTAIYNTGNLTSINGNYSNSGNGHFIYNTQTGILHLNKNTMSSNQIEKIYNLGLINSTVYVIYLNNNTVYAYIGNNIVLNATLKDDNNNTIVGQNVTFVIENLSSSVDVNNFTNGYYYLNFTVNQLGKYIVNGTYRGGNNLTILNGIILVEKLPTENHVSVPEKIIIGNTVVIQSKLTDKSTGLPMANQTIDFYINGVYIGSAVTDENGIARLSYKFNKTGTYQIFTRFNETQTHYGSNATNKTQVVKIPTENHVSVPEKIIVGDTVVIQSKLTDKSTGLPMANQTIDFYINGKYIGSAITDENGIARLNYTFNKAGNYQVSTKFNEIETHYGSNATNKTQVVKIPTITEIVVDGNKITATLSDDKGNLLEGKKIVFRVKGKVIGTGITDANGQVTIYYKDAYENTIIASFNGDNKYYGSNDVYEPKPDPNPKPNPINPNNTSTGASMKKTGIPIAAVLLILLTAFGLLGYKKNE